MRPAALALACAGLALGIGCGGDDDPKIRTTSPAAPTTAVEETAPEVTTSAPAAPGRTTPAPAAPESGGTTAPSRTLPPDSPEHDRPPKPGSPEERFERECERNPEACG